VKDREGAGKDRESIQTMIQVGHLEREDGKRERSR
jgi:hypothetical protein